MDQAFLNAFRQILTDELEKVTGIEIPKIVKTEVADATRMLHNNLREEMNAEFSRMRTSVKEIVQEQVSKILKEEVPKIVKAEMPRILKEEVPAIVEAEVVRQIAPIKEELRRVALSQENEVLPKIQLIYENQTQIIDEHNEIDRMDTDIRILKDDVAALKFVAVDHTKEIGRLKKAQ